MSDVDRPLGGYGRQQYFVRWEQAASGGSWLVYFGETPWHSHFVTRLRASCDVIEAILWWTGPHRAVTFLPASAPRPCLSER